MAEQLLDLHLNKEEGGKIFDLQVNKEEEGKLYYTSPADGITIGIPPNAIQVRVSRPWQPLGNICRWIWGEPKGPRSQFVQC